MPYKHNINLLLTLDSSGVRHIAKALSKGMISDDDLKKLNETSQFPSNFYGQVSPNEPKYTSMDCMLDFVKTILPCMSDQILFNITDRLCKIEVLRGQQALRNTTLAKVMLIEEFNRYQGKVNNNIIYHLKHFFPLFAKQFPQEKETNFKSFIEAYLQITLPEDFFKKIIMIDGANFLIQNSKHQIKSFDEVLEGLLSLQRKNSKSNKNNNSHHLPFEPDVVAIRQIESEIKKLEKNLKMLEIKIDSKRALLESLEKNPTCINFSIKPELIKLLQEKAELSFLYDGLQHQLAEYNPQKDNQHVKQLKNNNDSKSHDLDHSIMQDKNDVSTAVLKTLFEHNQTKEIANFSRVCHFWRNNLTNQQVMKKRAYLLNKLITDCRGLSLGYEQDINDCYNKFGKDESRQNAIKLNQNKDSLYVIHQMQYIFEEIKNNKSITDDMSKTFEEHKHFLKSDFLVEFVQLFSFQLKIDKSESLTVAKLKP